MTDSPTRSAAELIEHWAWTRRLAGHLVTDPAIADDVTQDAWLRASRHPDVRPTRGFLGAIVRNLVRERARGERHRTDRERASRVARTAPAPDEILASAETGQALAAAVFELPPPTRDVLLMRYFEEMSPVAIAAALDLPEGTVRSRIKRGLDALKARFDGRGDRPRLLALAGAPALQVGGGALAGWGVGRVTLGVAAAAAATALVVLVGRVQADGDVVETAVVRPSVDGGAKGAAELAAPSAPERRGAVALPEEAPATVAIEPRAVVVGRCVDERHRPLAGVAIRANVRVRRVAAVDVVSGPDGRFRAELPVHAWAMSTVTFEPDELRPRQRVVFHADGIGPARSLEAGTRDLGDVVLAPRGVVSVHVVDPIGDPLEGVSVEARTGSGRRVGGAQTDALGAARFGRLRPGTIEVIAFDLNGEVQARTRVDVVPGQVVDAQALTVVLGEEEPVILDFEEASEDSMAEDFAAPAVVNGRVTRDGVGVPGVAVIARTLGGRDAAREPLGFGADTFDDDLAAARELWGGGRHAWAITDEAGRFTLELHTRSVGYEVVACTETDHVRIGGVSVKEDVVDLGALELVPYADLTVRVVPPAGLLGWEFECEALSLGAFAKFQADANGLVRLPSMPAGAHTLFLSEIADRLDAGAGVRVDLLPGESRVVEIDAAAHGLCRLTLRAPLAHDALPKGHVVLVPEGEALPLRVEREDLRGRFYDALDWRGADLVAYVRAIGRADVGFVHGTGRSIALPAASARLTSGGDVALDLDRSEAATLDVTLPPGSLPEGDGVVMVTAAGGTAVFAVAEGRLQASSWGLEVIGERTMRMQGLTPGRVDVHLRISDFGAAGEGAGPSETTADAEVVLAPRSTVELDVVMSDL